MKQGRFILLIIFLASLLAGCLGTVWTGASLAYDRHDVYKKLNDYQISADINSALLKDKVFKNQNCVFDFAVFNGDVLVAGHLPSQEYLTEFNRRLSAVKGYNRLFNQVIIKDVPSNNLHDAWITGKIRSQIFSDETIDPDTFKIVTVDGIVYLMGDVKRDEAEKVIKISRNTAGVVRVVKLMKYFTYETK